MDAVRTSTYWTLQGEEVVIQQFFSERVDANGWVMLEQRMPDRYTVNGKQIINVENLSDLANLYPPDPGKPWFMRTEEAPRRDACRGLA